MRDKIKHMVMAIAALALASCNSIYEHGSCLSLDEPRDVSFVLAIDSPSSTRAEWGDNVDSDQLGNTFENRILPESLRIAVYTTDNVLLGSVESLVYWPINDEGTRYQFQGRMPQAVVTNIASETNYKFMVYANAAEGDNAELSYSFDQLDMTEGAIPMWGVKQVLLDGLQNHKSQDIGTISLLRATAKIEVVVDEALSACQIQSAAINYHNRTGYVLPTGWDSASDTKNIDRDACFRGLRSLHTMPHEFVEVDDGRKFVMYVPEYDNKLFPEFEAKVSVDVLYNGAAMSFPDALQFKRYENGRATGEASNIVRNTIYRFRITKVASGGLELEYEVADWKRSDSWEWVHHFDYPNYHNPVLPDSAPRDGSSSNDVYPVRPEMFYTAPNTLESIQTEDGAFSCWFQLTSPIGQTWLPTLRTASNQCVVRVYKEIDPMTRELVYTTETSATDPSLKDGSKLVAYTGWYNIKVIPIDADYTGVARFGITYSQEWMGAGSRYLLINGEESHIIWPNSGNEARIIDIQQVSN